MLEFAFWASLVLVVYVYAGYPVLIHLLAKRKGHEIRREEQEPTEWPFLTVLIPAHNEELWIRRKIENTLDLDYPRDRMQVLIASDGCTDRTVPIAGEFAAQGVEVNYVPERNGKTATLNRVVPTARGEIVLLTDANALLEKNAAKLLVKHFRDLEVGCVTGERVCIPTESLASEGEGLYWRYEAWIKHSESEVYSCVGSQGQIVAVRKELFPPIPVIGDDFYVPMKILISTEKRIVFEPRAIARIPASKTMRLELERKIRSHVSLLRDLPFLKDGLNPRKSRIWWMFLSHAVLRLFVPFAMMAAFLSSALLLKNGVAYRFLFLAQTVFYLAAFAGFLLQQIRARPKHFYLPFYFCFANWGVLLGCARWARRRHQYAWVRTERILPEQQSAENARTP
jgi:biofilm PGA synthesis N-glycosyltransferase PgaC